MIYTRSLHSGCLQMAESVARRSVLSATIVLCVGRSGDAVDVQCSYSSEFPWMGQVLRHIQENQQAW